jgi:hypothetical protein
MHCIHNNCPVKNATYNYIGENTPIYCSRHKKTNMIKFKIKIIRNYKKGFTKCELCNTKATFGFIGGKTRRCKTHIISGMVDVHSKKCEKCNKQPSYGYIGEKARMCFTHKLTNMIDLKHKHCELCDKRPMYSENKNLPPRFCCAHKNHIPNLVFIGKTCLKCTKIPSFGIPKGKAIYCYDHKDDNMVDLSHKECEKCNSKSAIYDNISGRGRFCKKHKEPDMINVKSKTCAKCNSVSPCWDIKGGTGKFCKKHKEPGMIDVKNKYCNKCNKRATYNFIGNTAKFCKKHIEIGMVDVSNKLCTECNTRVRYGIPGQPATRCTKHRIPGMIRRPNAKCKKCKQIALYGKNYYQKYCEQHKEDDDVNLIENKCISCNLVMILNLDNKCEYCNPEAFKNRLVKQNNLMMYLDSNNLNGNSTDKIINNGECGYERPDRFYDLNDKIIILECDENQHTERDEHCETTRMINISQSFGGISVYFIRWNPDDYQPFDNDVKVEQIKKRYETLKKFLNDIIDNTIKLPHALLSVFYMYYDNWECFDNDNWKIITNFEIIN